MPISFDCQCGKNYSVKDEFAGKRAKCKACGRVNVVPEPETFDAELLDEEPEQLEAELIPDEQELDLNPIETAKRKPQFEVVQKAPPPRPAPRSRSREIDDDHPVRRKRKRKSRTGGSSMIMRAGFIFLGGLMTLGAFLYFTSESEPGQRRRPVGAVVAGITGVALIGRGIVGNTSDA